MTQPKTFIVIPNWNGKHILADCLDSLLAQTKPQQIIVVENGSTDGSLEFLQKKYPEVILVVNDRNLGFAGGVNSGIKKAMELGAKYIALFNSDAVADKNWLMELTGCLEASPKTGIVAAKILSESGKALDSTGEFYTVWGLTYTRGRDETNLNAYDKDLKIFSASGGASLYRVKMLEEIGLFDEDFFAYYEDVDLSFRAQLAGWDVLYEPKAVAYHQIGATSGRIKGFTTYQSMKNLQLLYYKNVPRRYFWRVGWRLTLAQTLMIGRAFTRGTGWAAIKGDIRGTLMVMNKRAERRKIQSSKKVSDEYIWSMMLHDLRPGAKRG